MRWTLSLVAAPIHIRHPELDGATEYWHDQRLLSAEARWRGVLGLGRSLALEVGVPLRAVRDRIRYETPGGAPYTPADPDVHHRNETVSGFADPSLALQYGRAHGAWTWALSAGVTLPVGSTEENPFELGDAGQRHQHTQLGAGTVVPRLTGSLVRPLGAWRTQVHASASTPLAENGFGYRASGRFGGGVLASRALSGALSATLGADFSHENAERWDGRIEEEGNVGRSDLFVRLGAGLRVGGSASLGLQLQLPVWSDIAGSQVDLPYVLGFTLSR